MIHILGNIAIDQQEVRLDFVRASGPGGQNVNKVATAVQLRFDVAHSPSLPDDVRRRLRLHAGRKMTADGVLVIDARRFRTQQRNRRDALDRLIEMVRKAVVKPKVRRTTRPTAGSIRRRLEGKRRRSLTKRLRRTPGDRE